MNNLTDDYIAIDTNIFKDLLNPRKNTNCHIEKLLDALQSDCICLIVDKGGKIDGEYCTSIYNEVNDGNASSEYTELLRYWLNSDDWKEVDTRNGPTSAIKNIIGQNNTVDATFVCVAMVSDKTLITNDRADIINKGKRGKLLKLAKKMPCKCKSFEILDSKEAHGKL